MSKLEPNHRLFLLKETVISIFINAILNIPTGVSMGMTHKKVVLEGL